MKPNKIKSMKANKIREQIAIYNSSKSEIDTIIQGDCISIIDALPEKYVNLIFADPPYNLQLKNTLYRPNDTLVDGVDDDWDKFSSFEDYDNFTYKWLKTCQKLLKDDGTIWVIGSYHNIFRVGKIMQDLGYWIINDIIWVKTNPMPNFRGVRFTNAHETLIWAKKSQNQKKYIFNYQGMKILNDDKQMRSDWNIPICSGNERCKNNGSKCHPTQKPEALLRRIILSSSNVGDLVFDPFFGSGTTGAVAKKLKRHWLGIEKNPEYIKYAQKRIESVPEPLFPDEIYNMQSKRELPKVPFGNIIEVGLMKEGQWLYNITKEIKAQICVDGSLLLNSFRGSIHSVAAYVQNKTNCNGWEFWYCDNKNGLLSINKLREEYRNKYLQVNK